MQAEKLKETRQDQIRELERLSGLSASQARQLLLRELEDELRHDRAVLARQIDDEVRRDAERRARSILADRDAADRQRPRRRDDGVGRPTARPTT